MEQGAGAYPLQNNIDGDYIVARDWDHAVNGQKLGLRSLLKIKPSR